MQLRGEGLCVGGRSRRRPMLSSAEGLGAVSRRPEAGLSLSRLPLPDSADARFTTDEGLGHRGSAGEPRAGRPQCGGLCPPFSSS